MFINWSRQFHMLFVASHHLSAIADVSAIVIDGGGGSGGDKKLTNIDGMQLWGGEGLM